MTTDTRPGSRALVRPTVQRQPAAVLHPNLFAIPLGLAGLALAWSTAQDRLGAPRWPATVLWLLAAATLTVIAVAYAVQVVRGRRLLAELQDPIFGPFTAVPAILVMLFGGALADYSPPAARVVFGVGLVATLAIGGYLSGQWIISDIQLAQWHPGYFVPTVAGGLIAAGISAALGFPGLAQLMFGYGILCWITLGSIILARLFTQPALPPALWPTVAIEVAPPAIAGNAWLAMNGGRVDLVAMMLTGFGLLMVLVQLRLIPVYLRVPFGPGTWAFSFSYAAAVAFALRWMAAEHVPGWPIVAYVLLLVLTLGVLALGVWTVRALVRRTFLPRAPAPAAPVRP